jgi:hypothetical protein
MSRWYPSVSRAAVTAVCLAIPVALAEEPDRKRAVPAYGNQDLDRVHEQREQIGSASVPAKAAERPARNAPASRDRGEEFWRREAEAYRGRVAVLQRALADLEDKSTTARRSSSASGRKPAAAPPPSFERRIAALQARIHDEEMRFLDRARREGALPGWLR